MASVSTSHIIFFTASLIISSTVATLFISMSDEISQALYIKNRDLIDTIAGDITIINDPKNVSVNPLKIYVKNTGETVIPLDEEVIDVFVDGVYYDYTLTSLSGNPQWEPYDVVEISINVSLSQGAHRVKVYVWGKIWDEMKFRV